MAIVALIATCPHDVPGFMKLARSCDTVRRVIDRRTCDPFWNSNGGLLVLLVLLGGMSAGGCGTGQGTRSATDAAIDSPGSSSDSNEGSPTSVSVLISGQRIEGTILHNDFTITSFPMAFVSTLSVASVARGTQLLATAGEISTSCDKPLDVIDAKSPPRYAIKSVLVNPFSSQVLLSAVRSSLEGQDVSNVTNPVRLASELFDDASFQTGMPPDDRFADGVLGDVDLPVGNYSWTILCGAIQGTSAKPYVKLAVKGMMGDQAYEGQIAFSSIAVVP